MLRVRSFPLKCNNDSAVFLLLLLIFITHFYHGLSFFDDCGLEEYNYLCYEIDQVRSEYLAAETVRNVEQIDVP